MSTRDRFSRKRGRTRGGGGSSIVLRACRKVRGLGGSAQLLWLVVVGAVPAPASALSIGIEPAFAQLEAGEVLDVHVVVSDVPAPGLAAFQFDIVFDSGSLEDPNEALGVLPFAPLGDWFLTATGRSAIGRAIRDGNRITVAYGTSGADPLPLGGGKLAAFELVGDQVGAITLSLQNVILADASDPPMSFPFTASGATIVVVPEAGTGTMLALSLAALSSSGRARKQGRGPWRETGTARQPRGAF